MTLPEAESVRRQVLKTLKERIPHAILSVTGVTELRVKVFGEKQLELAMARVETVLAIATTIVPPPRWWNCSSQATGSVLVELHRDRNAAECRYVEARFREQRPFSDEAAFGSTIVSIHRVQNTKLWHAYFKRCRDIESANGGTCNEL
jgi:hypothetical protein